MRCALSTKRFIDNPSKIISIHLPNFLCNKIKPPYRSYEKFKENPDLKNKVQCPLYIDNCVNYSSKFGLRPCVVLYMGLEKEKEKS